MKSKNPTIAALLGLVFGQLAYIYVWRIGRGLLVLALNFLLFSLLFGNEVGYTPELLATSLAVNILISFDCWRVAKLSQKGVSVEKDAEAPAPQASPETIQQDINCPACGIGLAIPVKNCPMCGAETGLIAGFQN